MRILFLDDDPARATAFALGRSDVVWVKTAEECLARLEETWDEVHLDHDLGGEMLVDHERDDCGMAVVRWLSEEPRIHLQQTRFVIHSHNENAACIMTLHLEVMGYQVKVRPFGRGSSHSACRFVSNHQRSIPLVRRIVNWLSGRSIPKTPD